MRAALLSIVASTSLLAGCDDSTKDQPWALPEFQYYDAGGFLSITGSLIGDDVGYKNNTWKIICVDGEKTCTVASVEEIGRNQLGEIDVGRWDVTNYNAQTITLDYNDPSSCGHPMIVINRVARRVSYTSSPMNQDKDWCKKYNKFVHQQTARTNAWQIGDPNQPWEE
jgi:hypothetical protein